MKFLFLRKLQEIFCLFFLASTCIANIRVIAEEGLPLFWWKEGDFVNFGDHISYILVEKLVGFPLETYNKRTENQKQKLLASGSILYFANDSDVVWGSGINGKRLDKSEYLFNSLDVRAVRGPLTKKFLWDNFKIFSPEVYGDPALLFPYLFPEFKRHLNPQNDYLVILHYLDSGYFIDTTDSHFISAIERWDVVVKEILNSKFVISSSLHGIILAEAYGIPARLLRLNEEEPLFKFYDYYLGTGRKKMTFAKSIEEALAMGGEPKINCDVEKIYRAFPFELWPTSSPLVLDFGQKAHE